MVYALACIALGLPVSAFTSIGLGMILLPLLSGIFLSWLLLRYDVLTVAIAISTMVLVTLNTPLLDIFRETGTSSHFALFGVWIALLFSACLIAFQKHFTDLLREFGD